MGVGQTPAAFKASIEARLKKAVDPARGRDLHRLRVLIVMERFIARVNHVLPKTTVLKGGLALELRLDQARTTKDLDLRVLGSPVQLDDQLRAIESHRPHPDDHFQFVIRPDPVHPTITGDGVKYEGYRYKVKTTLAGKIYVGFGLDVAFGDPILGEPELLRGTDFFEKYEIPAIAVRTYPVPSHLAEKLHAYTLPLHAAAARLVDPVLRGDAGTWSHEVGWQS
ncbi:MAG: nucleotidyl transferase AbiEii/AbiGii toxin family protein [Myxococcales bacterium]|nr:nucleotidyl transferase AbiEii/AbiGii toxin family protein [Myxococcales bacterium]